MANNDDSEYPLSLMECLPGGIKGDSVEFIIPREYTEYIFKD